MVAFYLQEAENGRQGHSLFFGRAGSRDNAQPAGYYECLTNKMHDEDLPRLIQEAKAGRVEFRVDKTSNLHVPIGKVSFDTEKLVDNMTAFLEVVKKARPNAVKGAYIRKITVASTMGPGVKVDPVEAQALESA